MHWDTNCIKTVSILNYHESYSSFYLFLMLLLTATTESRAATARISAQETTPGQALSSEVLMVSITSKPLKESTFGPAVFSPVKLEVSSNKTEASHPCLSHKIDSSIVR